MRISVKRQKVCFHYHIQELNMKMSSAVKRFLANGGTIKKIPPEETFKKFNRQYKKDRSVMGPSKQCGWMGKTS